MQLRTTGDHFGAKIRQWCVAPPSKGTGRGGGEGESVYTQCRYTGLKRSKLTIHSLYI